MKLKHQIFFCLIYLVLNSCNDKKENNSNQPSLKDSLKKDSLSHVNSSKNNKKDNLLSNDNTEIEKVNMEDESIGKLKYGLSFQKVIELFGNPNKETKAELWTADGEYHQTVKYLDKGIELDIIGNYEDEKKINMITINKPSELKTSKNIGIGSDFKTVEKAYKNQIDTDFSNKESIVIGTIYGGIIFTFKNNKVESIFIGASAE